jgi:hypothetical protein
MNEENPLKCYAIVDIRISPDHPNFRQYEQYPLIIIPNVIIPDEIIPEKMKQYRDVRNEGKSTVKSGKLMSTNCAIEAALISPYIKYLIEKGATVDKVHEIVVYENYAPIFEWFRDAVTKARQTGDDITLARSQDELSNMSVEEIQELKEALQGFAESMKLAGNTFYGKALEDITKYINTVITNSESTLSKKYNSPLFISMDGVINETIKNEDGSIENYCSCVEIKMKKNKIKINRHFAIGIYVYQYSKMILIKFIHDFLLKYIPDKCIALTHTDTDSIYFGLAGNTEESKQIIKSIAKMDLKKDFKQVAEAISAVVPDELKEQYKEDCYKFLVMDKKNMRVPGIAKLEHIGVNEYALCSKMYAIGGGEKYKHTNKGISKYNLEDTRLERFEDCINDYIYSDNGQHEPQSTINRGFKKLKDNTIVTYEQKKLALSAYYDKRYVLDDGINTKPFTDWYEDMYKQGKKLCQ